MTNINYTHISVILDRSGSMEHLTDETISGFNTFLAEQKNAPGKATLTLATFASDCTIVHDFLPLGLALNLSKLSNPGDMSICAYKTGGYTSLYDAVGRTVNSVGAKLASMKEEDRPSKVITVIITDGKENASKEFAYEVIRDMIAHQQDKYGWSFVYLASTIGEVEQAKSLGIRSKNIGSYIPSAAGMTANFNTISESMTSYRASIDPKTDFFGSSSSDTGSISISSSGDIKVIAPEIKITPKQ